MNEEVVPTAAVAIGTATSQSATDVAVFGIVLRQLELLEARLGQKIDDNSAQGRHRWEQHEQAHHELLLAHAALKERVDAHLRDEERDDLIMQARLGPVKRASAWVYREWRTLAILALLLADFFGTVTDDLRRVIGH